MKASNTTIIFSLLFVIALMLYASLADERIPVESERQAAIGEAVSSALEEVPEPQENAAVTEEPQTPAPLPLDAFDETTLEEESASVQKGIDLLNGSPQ